MSRLWQGVLLLILLNVKIVAGGAPIYTLKCQDYGRGCSYLYSQMSRLWQGVLLFTLLNVNIVAGVLLFILSIVKIVAGGAPIYTLKCQDCDRGCSYLYS